MLMGIDKPAEAKELIGKALAACPDKTKAPSAFFLLLAAVENGTPPVADGLKRAFVGHES